MTVNALNICMCTLQFKTIGLTYMIKLSIQPGNAVMAALTHSRETENFMGWIGGFFIVGLVTVITITGSNRKAIRMAIGAFQSTVAARQWKSGGMFKNSAFPIGFIGQVAILAAGIKSCLLMFGA